ncbi:MAG TPA: aconitate hydratase [Bacteroidales bacterium]|jgi:aconitate hydratase|nr:aconitate hydratase [Bacteroidales bacterium]
MVLDFELIERFYSGLPQKISLARQALKRPLTLAEKILCAHLFQERPRLFNHGEEYADFAPDRIAMQDATAQMAILQFMSAGMDKTAVPASIHCDHLIVARDGAEKDLEAALSSNREVYDFLRSSASRYKMDFWKPGSGIIHQAVLENYAFPGGMMIGTDSHTPNAGGLGMIAIGVGGADAVDVMVGMGWELKFPKITGVKLTGKLSGWCSPKDIILKLAGILTVKGGTGHIIEYFGEGAESLSCTGKATICNMGAETGATCSLFGYDKSMEKYLNATGRKEVAKSANEISMHLVADPEVLSNPESYYDRYLEINLSELEPYINGPFTPDLATPVSRMKEVAAENGWPVNIEAGLIGSCTNSSYEDLSRAASVVKNAVKLKLEPKAEFRITPGSGQVKAVAEKDGFLDAFRLIGGEVYANACGPCIGQWDRKSSDSQKVNTVIHSFNRNFSKRTDGNPNTHAFVASPEIVTALAIAGNLTFNPLKDTLVNSEGKSVALPEPVTSELPDSLAITEEKGLVRPDGSSNEVVISPGSDRLQKLEPFQAWDGKDFKSLPLLMKVKGKCTTDHISMAGPWLRYRGHLENISGNYMIGAVNSFNGKTNNILKAAGSYDTVPATAKLYRDLLGGSVVIGEENFGEGSSREHAAMEPRFLGVKAIIVKSFARIHETNLKKQGVLTLTFADKNDYDKIREQDIIDIKGLSDFGEGKPLMVTLHHSDGKAESFPATHSYNDSQIEWFKAGSALNIIRKIKHGTGKNQDQ